MEAVERFAALVHGPEAAIPLDEAALLIAAATKPEGADVAAALAALDDVAEQVVAPTLDGLRAVLFRDLGYGGNPDDYYDPSNSWLDDVIERRVGIPITLAVVMIEVGRRVGVPLAGVSMPGHFLVRDKVDPDVFVDPFARGRELDRDGCAARFHSVQGPGSVFDDAFLDPVGKRAILVRMLANLETVATMRTERVLLQQVLALRVALPDAGLIEHRKYAASLATAGQFDKAAAVLERWADVPDAEGAVAARAQADQLRARLN
jgi:regulator of sirC expression with transglutaminase-like and TPR domain